MSLTKPRTTSGVLELLPHDQVAFQAMLDGIRRAYERFGFLPIETPVFELAEVLLTKTGGETERQVYYAQSAGALKQGDTPELALRFDLTVPLARYVAEHERELAFPFRRYQIQRVYRGETAQRGRFREFYQCDADVIGKDQLSIRHDAELVALIHTLFDELRIGRFHIGLNHRRLLLGALADLGIDGGERAVLVLRELDKLDKRGQSAVRATLLAAPLMLGEQPVDALLGLAATRASGAAAAIGALRALPFTGAEFCAGRDELIEILTLIARLGVPDSAFGFNGAIARGLDYYTGVVMETTLRDHQEIGSICSGGRYADLASHYTRSRLPGVGVSIGATRLYFQLQQAGLLAGQARSSVQVMVAQLDSELSDDALLIARQLRGAGLNTELQLEVRKLAKQLQYADKARIPFVVLLGPDERARGEVLIRDLRRGDQYAVAAADLVHTLRVELAQIEAGR